MNKPIILVVEDEALIAANLVETLSSLGYKVHEPVATGEEAIRAVKNQKPDLVLMDIELFDEMNGIEAAEKIRTIADIPVVYLTANTDDMRIQQAQHTEPYGYIVKPAHIRELKATIEMALYKHAIDRKLRESELHYRELADSITDIFFALDYELRYTHWNKASENLTGIKSNDAIGRSISDVFKETPEILKATEIYRDVLKTRKPRTFESRFITGDSSIFFEIRVYPTFGGISVFTRDITKRKVAEEALEKESRMRTALLDNIPGCIALILKKGSREIIASNRFAHEIGAVPGKTCFNTCAMRDDNCPFCLAPKLWQTGQTQRLEVEYRGTWYEGIWAPLSEDLFVHYIFDISERKRAEEALRQSEDKLRAILDATPFPIAMVDLQDNNINFWSHSALLLFGHTAPTAPAWYQLAYPDPEYQRDVIARWKPCLEEAKISGLPVNTGEYRVTCRDGSVRICEIYATFLADQLIVTFNDITGRKRVEEILRQSEERYRVVADFTSDWEYWIAPDGKFIYVSPSSERISGFRPEEFVLDPNLLVSITHTHDRQKIIDHLSRPEPRQGT